MSQVTIRGYAAPLTVPAGGQVTFHVSSDVPTSVDAQLVRIRRGDVDPRGPGPLEDLVVSPVNGTYEVAPQATECGGYVEVPDPTARLGGRDGLGLHVFVYPTLPARGRQALISRWDDRRRTGWALWIENGRLQFTIGDGTDVASVSLDRGLFPETWYSVAAGYDPGSGILSVQQRPVVSAVNGRAGRVVPLDSSSEARESVGLVPAVADVPVLLAAVANEGGVSTSSTANFNGKLDDPRVHEAPLDGAVLAALCDDAPVAADRVLAHWDFSAEIGPSGVGTDRVTDVSGGGLHGACRNVPDRGMTGWNWKGREENFVHAPDQYGAIWFHSDSLEDCRWDPTVTVDLPEDLASGCYALRLRTADDEDHVPFFVVPPRGTATAKVAVLMPTWTYMAYANVRTPLEVAASQAVFAHTGLLDKREVEVHERTGTYGLSTYEHHGDGRGNQFTSALRPIMNLRPKHRSSYGTTWNFQTDLKILEWLDKLGIAYDVITDHELHREGVDALAPYRAVITGSHPEYYSWEMIDGWEEYLASGGRGMYLGGNGMYWVTSQHPEKPHVLEVRRCESGDQSWRARPGEYHHATTGERGGLWRHRGRAPQKVWGTGMTSHMLDTSAPFYALPDAHDPRVDWIFAGVDRGRPIGDFGLAGDGAAGQEVDRYDVALGTPPHALLLASSFGHTSYDMIVPEDQYFPSPGMNGAEHPLVRADLVYFTTPNGGAMFAASSMTWMTSLSHRDYENDVSRITENVVRRFAEDGPVPSVV